MTPSPEPPATADGVRLAELAASLPLSRTSVFEVVKALAIVTSKGPGPEGRGRVAWMTDTEATRITAAAQAVHRGEVRIADLSRPTRQTPPTVPGGALATASAGWGDRPSFPTLPPFLARLEAAESAISSGLELTTAETAWILGSRPTGPTVTRGGITATRTGWNYWRLLTAAPDAPDPADPGPLRLHPMTCPNRRPMEPLPLISLAMT